MADWEDINEVLMDEIDKAIEVHLEEEVGSVWVASKHEENQLHPHIRNKLKKRKKTPFSHQAKKKVIQI